MKWLSVNSNVISLKKDLNKIAFLLIVAAGLLSGSLSELLFWIAILIAIFLTYLNYKYK